jgi:hypothetical protein
LVAIYLLNLVDDASNSRNNGSLVSILESTDLMKFCVLTYCMKCPNVAVVACLTMLLKLDDIDDNAMEWATGFVSARTMTDVFFHLALDAWNAIISPLITLAISTYLEASRWVFEMLNSLIAWVSKQLMCTHCGNNLRSFLLAWSNGHAEKLVTRRAVSLPSVQQPMTMTVSEICYNIGDLILVEDVASWIKVDVGLATASKCKEIGKETRDIGYSGK